MRGDQTVFICPVCDRVLNPPEKAEPFRHRTMGCFLGHATAECVEYWLEPRVSNVRGGGYCTEGPVRPRPGTTRWLLTFREAWTEAWRPRR